MKKIMPIIASAFLLAGCAVPRHYFSSYHFNDDRTFTLSLDSNREINRSSMNCRLYTNGVSMFTAYSTMIRETDRFHGKKENFNFSFTFTLPDPIGSDLAFYWIEVRERSNMMKSLIDLGNYFYFSFTGKEPFSQKKVRTISSGRIDLDQRR